MVAHFVKASVACPLSPRCQAQLMKAFLKLQARSQPGPQLLLGILFLPLGCKGTGRWGTEPGTWIHVPKGGCNHVPLSFRACSPLHCQLKTRYWHYLVSLSLLSLCACKIPSPGLSVYNFERAGARRTRVVRALLFGDASRC